MRSTPDFCPKNVPTWTNGWTNYEFVDVMRSLAGDIQGPYTWWSQRGRAFDNNVGWRIDYQFATPELAETARGFVIDAGSPGRHRWSGHAPTAIASAIAIRGHSEDRRFRAVPHAQPGLHHTVGVCRAPCDACCRHARLPIDVEVQATSRPILASRHQRTASCKRDTDRPLPTYGKNSHIQSALNRRFHQSRPSWSLPPGMASSRSRVYCFCGWSKTSSVVACSTSLPCCITTTSSAI